MGEAKTYPSDPVELPLRMDLVEPIPVEGCPGCTELANVRDRARAGGDMTTVTDCNVFMRRHPEGHA
ncbi:hypothetical protein [Streptomyces purpurogeneiscleroticus]|uniref:hypothetical protein n=1 Tax=Streptomyces purpurogeneiscleroticus TaxID=68259 RepID=UPI001CBF91D5|nr:hypothetical protein [Streptomyces purpurogeneiscleroticus]MBZ4020783.1 hypothetical protein [Streptomyces purpurogeneiscleroticus]